MPPNQFAQVTSCTSGVALMVSAYDAGMLKIIEVERIVTRRVAELAADTAAKPSSTARSAENRNTASAPLILVNAVRRLRRRGVWPVWRCWVWVRLGGSSGGWTLSNGVRRGIRL